MRKHTEEENCLQSEGLGWLSGPANYYLFQGGGFESRVAVQLFSEKYIQSIQFALPNKLYDDIHVLRSRIMSL